MQKHTWKHTHTHTHTDAHKGSEEYSVVVFCKNVGLTIITQKDQLNYFEIVVCDLPQIMPSVAASS